MKRWVIELPSRGDLRIDEVGCPAPLPGKVLVSAPTVPVLLKVPVIRGIVTGHRRALGDLGRAVNGIELKAAIDRRYPSPSCRPRQTASPPVPTANMSSTLPHIQERTRHA